MSIELIALIVVGVLVLRVAWRLSDVREELRQVRALLLHVEQREQILRGIGGTPESRSLQTPPPPSPSAPPSGSPFARAVTPG